MGILLISPSHSSLNFKAITTTDGRGGPFLNSWFPELCNMYICLCKKGMFITSTYTIFVTLVELFVL